tara:strand:+ start:1922 stop:2308 length:387 start_codon:yes stop_codon:yes gene_type:complete
MSYFLIKDLKPENISIKKYNKSYRIFYKNNYSQLSGIYIRLKDIVIKELNDKYVITINDKHSLELLNIIDKYIKSKLNVKPILNNNNLFINKNIKTIELIKKYTNTIDIYIFMIKDVAYQTSPIVYIL